MPANHSTSRIQNQKEILDALLQQGEMSRTDLAKHLGLSKPAITENIDRLLEAGLVKEVGVGAAGQTGGRRPRMLSFYGGYQYIICIEICASYATVAVGDLAGNILLKRRQEDDCQDVDALIGLAEKLFADSKINPSKLGLVVVCSPFVPEYGASGRPARWQRTAEEKDLKEKLRESFSVPVVQKNHMNASALAAYILGSGRNAKNMVFISCGAGLGAGVILEGKIYQGSRQSAGELAFCTSRMLYEKGRTLGEELCMGGLLRQIQKDQQSGAAKHSLLAKQEQISFGDVVRAYRQNDAYVHSLIRYIGEELGFIITNAVVFLDLDRVVIGGEYLAFYETLSAGIQAVLDRCPAAAGANLFPSALGEDAILCGGLLLAREELFARMEL